MTVGFPGGLDILGFTATVPVPADLGITAPYFQDPGFRLDFSGALDLVWSAGDPAAAPVVALTGSVFAALDPFNPPPPDFVPPTTAATCELPDTGSGAIPARVMSRFSAGSNFVIFAASRSNTVEVNVDLTGGGSGTVVPTAATSLAWTFADITVLNSKR